MPRTSSNSRCGSRATAWASCSKASTASSSPTSATSSATSAARAKAALRPRRRRGLSPSLPQDHPYYAAVIGSHADIEAARINDVRDFHQQFYTPNNASIAIAGDFDPAQLKELLTKYFGPIPRARRSNPSTSPRRRSPRRSAPPSPTPSSCRSLRIAWLSPAAFTPGDAEPTSLSTSSAEAKPAASTRLVYKQQIAQSVNCCVRCPEARPPSSSATSPPSPA